MKSLIYPIAKIESALSIKMYAEAQQKQCPLENFQLSIDTTNTQKHSHKGSIIREQQWKKKKKTKSS